MQMKLEDAIYIVHGQGSSGRLNSLKKAVSLKDRYNNHIPKNNNSVEKYIRAHNISLDKINNKMQFCNHSSDLDDKRLYHQLMIKHYNLHLKDKASDEFKKQVFEYNKKLGNGYYKKIHTFYENDAIKGGVKK